MGIMYGLIQLTINFRPVLLLLFFSFTHVILTLCLNLAHNLGSV